MRLVEISEVHKQEVVHKDNQWDILLAKNRQVGVPTKHIDTCHYFLRDISEDKHMDLKHIWSKENPADVITNNCFKDEHAKHAKIFTEREL